MTKEEAFKELLLKAIQIYDPKEPYTAHYFKENYSIANLFSTYNSINSEIFVSKEMIYDVFKFKYKMKNDNEIALFIKAQFKEHLGIEAKLILTF